MPKMKKIIDDKENDYPLTKKLKKKNKPYIKFDMKKILKERQAESKIRQKSAILDKEIEKLDVLFQAEVDKANINKEKCPCVQGYIIFDQSKYNAFLKNSSDIKNSFYQKFVEMSIEKNEFMATIHYNNLLKANWSPTFNDVQNILFNWGTDFDTLIYIPPSESQIENDSYSKIGQHNFELVINFITQSILKNNGFSNSDLLILAKFAVTISLDYHCGQMVNVIKTLFCSCIETALVHNDETSIISFGQELYSHHVENNLLKIVVDLFLPMNGLALKKLYTYLTYKLYKSFLGKAYDLNSFPSGINDWFVQDFVNKDYFKQRPSQVLYNVIQLLEHVVVVFDLYQNENKLSNMYDFFSVLARPTTVLDSSRLNNVLDLWNLQLFRLHVNRTNILY